MNKDDVVVPGTETFVMQKLAVDVGQSSCSAHGAGCVAKIEDSLRSETLGGCVVGCDFVVECADTRDSDCNFVSLFEKDGWISSNADTSGLIRYHIRVTLEADRVYGDLLFQSQLHRRAVMFVPQKAYLST